MYFPSPRKRSSSRKGRGANDLVVLVAADLMGAKRNMRFVFPTRPTLRELTHQVEQAYQREAVMQAEEGVDFKVSHLAAYCEEMGMWIKLVRQSQLATGVQLYAFQRRSRRRDGSLSRPGSAYGSPSPSRGRSMSTSRTTHGSPRADSASRRALLDQIRFVFNCLATPNARWTPPPSPRGMSPHARRRSRSIGSSMVIELEELGALLLRRGVHEYAGVVRSIMASVDLSCPGHIEQISLAQFVRWGRKHPETVRGLFSRCESMRWAPAASQMGADLAQGAASGASLATPAPVPHLLPQSPISTPQPFEQTVHTESPLREFLQETPLLQPVPNVPGYPEVPLSPTRALQYPAEAPPPETLPPASPLPHQLHGGVVHGGGGGGGGVSPVLPPPGAERHADLGRANYQEWRQRWLETEIHRLEVEHQSRVAALRVEAASFDGVPPP